MRFLLCLFLCFPLLCRSDVIDVGSKRFTESYILAEIVSQTIEHTGEAHARHRPGLGNTAVVFAALKSGAIQIYPEYSGTIAFELLGLPRVPDLPALNERLAPYGITAGIPLGFSNNYALAMSRARAAELGITKISDLGRHPRLRLGLTQEFLSRKDGWPALSNAYGLRSFRPLGIDHGLAYEALGKGQVDVIDAYATDAKLADPGVIVLADDRHFFPVYEALLLYRSELRSRFPMSWGALQALQGRISAEKMRAMNAAAELSYVPFDRVAASFLSSSDTTPQPAVRFVDVLFGADFWRLTAQHAALVFASLGASSAVGMLLGICAWRNRHAGRWILAIAGVLQTVPSLALLAFLITMLNRIGTLPAIVALFLYALLPIVRNTEAGLSGIPRGVTESAISLGLSRRDRLTVVELPLAAPVILAGIRTAAVINVGTATIAAFIGAGGYGERIVAGLAVNDHALLLAGALPAAAMALAIEWGFGALESRMLQARGGAARTPDR